MSNQQKDSQAPGGSDVAGKAGGTDAAAGAGTGGDGGQGLRRKEKDDTGGPRGDELSNAVGAAAAGGTGLGEAASASDSRTGTSSFDAASLTGGDPSNGSIPPPTNKGGASSA